MLDERQLRVSAGRRPRRSDAETEERMLQAGEEFVRVHGLSLSLEHLNMEDLIRDADVSRTSSYRRWPTKDRFAADLLVRLAHGRLAEDLEYLVASLEGIPAGMLRDVDSQAGRHDLLVEVIRRTMVEDFAATAESPRWRAYINLRAAHVALPSGDLRDEVAAGLRKTERRFTTQRAFALRTMADLAGYRLRAPDVFDWEQVSLSVSGMVTGLVIRAYSDQDAVGTPRVVAPFGSRHAAAWNAAALASASLLLGALEPDPDVTWDAARIARLTGALADARGTLESMWAEAIAADPAGLPRG